MSDYLYSIYTTLLGIVVSAAVWLVRTVLTNNKKIALLEAELKAREEARHEDRKVLIDKVDKISKGQEKLRQEILDIYKRNPNL